MRERRSKAVYGGGGEGIVRDGRSEWERTCGCGPGAARTNERAEIGTGGEDWPEEPTSSDGGSDVARSQSPAINSSIRPGFCRSQLDPLLVAGSVVFSTSPRPTCSTSPQRRARRNGRSSGWPQEWPPPQSPSAQQRSPCPFSSPMPTSTTSASRTTSPSSATGLSFPYHPSSPLSSSPFQAQAATHLVRKDCLRSP